MLMIFLRRCAAVLAFSLAFVVNPLYVTGCASSDDEDAERAAQTKAALIELLDDVNGEGSFAFEAEGVQYELLLELSQAKRPAESARAPSQPSFVSVAHACGQQTFYQSASACDTIYELAVEGTFTLRRLGDSPETIATDVPVSGMLGEYGELSLEVGSAGMLYVERTENGAFELAYFVADDVGGQSFDVPGS